MAIVNRILLFPNIVLYCMGKWKCGRLAVRGDRIFMHKLPVWVAGEIEVERNVESGVEARELTRINTNFSLGDL